MVLNEFFHVEREVCRLMRQESVRRGTGDSEVCVPVNACFELVQLVQQFGRGVANASTPGAGMRGGVVAGTRPLHWFASRGKGDYVGLLLARGALHSLTDSMGHTPLILAAAANSPVAVRALLDHGAALDIRDISDRNALTHAAMCPGVAQPTDDSDSDRVIAMLLSAGAERYHSRRFLRMVNARDARGYTPVVHAAKVGRLRAVQMLVRHGAHHVVTFDGESLVEVAIKYGHLDVANWLRANTLSNTEVDRRHATVLHREVAAGVDEYGDITPPVAL